MRVGIFYLLLLVSNINFSFYLIADQITVSNETDQNLFVRSYYYQGPGKDIIAQDKQGRVSEKVEILAYSSTKMKRLNGGFINGFQCHAIMIDN
jgi:hypothetical protein